MCQCVMSNISAGLATPAAWLCFAWLRCDVRPSSQNILVCPLMNVPSCAVAAAGGAAAAWSCAAGVCLLA